jgi:hypothetical protein
MHFKINCYKTIYNVELTSKFSKRVTRERGLGFRVGIGGKSHPAYPKKPDNLLEMFKLFLINSNFNSQMWCTKYAWNEYKKIIND